MEEMTPDRPRSVPDPALDRFFTGREESWQLFRLLQDAVTDIGPAQVQVMKSQVVFRRNKAFAWVWTPGRYLKRKCAPLVLTLSFGYRHPSLRWKQVVEPYPGRFTHHLELYSSNDIDDEVRGWLRDAWAAAG